MSSFYTKDFQPAPSHRLKVREKRFINRVVAGQPIAMDHALFLPSTLAVVRDVLTQPELRSYLETDLRLLTGEADTNIPWYVDRLINVCRELSFSTTDQISEEYLHRIIRDLNCGLSPQKASEALWGMDVYISDHDLPFDQLTWGLHWLQNHEYLPNIAGDTLLSEHNGGDCLLVRKLELLCDTLLINQNGSVHSGRVRQLERWPGVEHRVLESDTFGPLRCGLRTVKGTLCYG